MDTITGFLYYLQNPITDEIFYVGATEISLRNRLRSHYQHLREFERGLRKTNKRYEYLVNLRPAKATIHLLEIVTNKDELIKREVFYIQHFRQINPNLTNMTDGGRGQHTSKYYTEQELEEYSAKISKANKGRSKPKGFAENLSATRKGLNNPAAKELDDWIVYGDNEKALGLFKYGFEINNFLNNKNAYSNVCAYLKRDGILCYNYKWKYFSQCNKRVQDIVQSSYESLR